MPDFAPPRVDRPIDASTILAAMPPSAATKGVILQAAIDQALGYPELAGWTPAQILAEACGLESMPGPFHNVPFRHHLATLVFLAERLRGPALGEGLREVGKGVFPSFTQTLVGRMLFGALGRDVGRVMMMGPAAWKVCNNFGDVQATSIGPRHVRYTYVEHPIELIETMYVGTIDGAAPHFGITFELGIADAGRGRTLLDIQW